MPRILRDVSNIDTSTTMFGAKVTFPFGFSPAAMHCLAHPDGEIATSRAAAKAGIAMGVSTWATKSMEDIAAVGKRYGNPYAMQTSASTSRLAITALLKKGEECGYKAVLVTVDIPVIGRRLGELRNGFDLPPSFTFPNVLGDDGKPPASFQSITRDASTVSSISFSRSTHSGILLAIGHLIVLSLNPH